MVDNIMIFNRLKLSIDVKLNIPNFKEFCKQKEKLMNE